MPNPSLLSWLHGDIAWSRCFQLRYYTAGERLDQKSENVRLSGAVGMAVYGKVIPLGAGDASVIREDVDEASTMAHDAVADCIFQLEWVIAGGPVALRYHRNLRTIRNKHCDQGHSGLVSQSCYLCQLGIKIMPLHLPFGIRFGLQKTGVVTVFEIGIDVLVLTLARDQEVFQYNGRSRFFPVRSQPLAECSLRNGSHKLVPETPRLHGSCG